MHNFKIKLAGRIISISTLHEDAFILCRDYLTDDATDFKVATSAEDIERERQLNYETDMREGRTPSKYSDGYLETLAVYRKIAVSMLDYDTLLFHGSALALDGEAYIFTAPSGTGKSTHRRIWQEQFGDKVVVINDDKPLIRICAEGVYVCGTPWDGKDKLSTNIEAPLKAICILQRGAANEIEQIDFAKAMPQLLVQCYMPGQANQAEKMLSLLDELAHIVKFYKLSCNMEPEAAEIAYEGMK